jgi:long-chain fatty acid transport protein
MFNRLMIISMATAFMACGSAFAAGFEKAIMWGGRTAGVGGIASPYIQGPQALYFNPAGLVSDKVGQGVDLNITAIQSQFKGPIDNSNTVAESEKKITTPFGLIYGATLNEDFGFGIGGYVSAGSQAKFDDITISATGPTNTAEGQKVETELTVVELAAGAAYKIMPNLRIGAAYRVSFVSGQFAFIQRGASNAVVNATIEDLEGVNALGYKIGAQYDLSENTKLGLSYRSETNLEAKGKFGGTVKSPLSASYFPIDPNNATAKTTLPQALTLGAQHKFGADWDFLAEYVWTQYSRVEHITLDGAVTRSGGTAVAADAGDLETQWRDQHQVKLGGEWHAMMMPVRFGYIWTSQVTSDDFGRASFTPPGIAHTITLGTAYNFGESFKLDGALDYTTVSGEGNGAAAGTTSAGSDIRAGKFETTAVALHLGVSYSF